MKTIDFEQIFRQAPIAFSIVDLDGRQIDGSDRYWTLLGVSATSLTDAEAVVRLTDADADELTRLYFEQMTSGAVDQVSVEKRYRRDDGELIWARLHASPILNADGDIVAIAGVIIDISKEREARDALIASEVQRAKSDHRVVAEAIKRFVSGIDQQVRSPLHSILGLSELMANGLTPTLAQSQALHDEALRLRHIVEEISAFANDRAGSTRSPDGPPLRFDRRWAEALDASIVDHREQPTPPNGRGGAAPHVLVVDDGEVNRLLAVSQLHRLGYSTTTASNGLEAVDLVSDGNFDAVLMDWHMPVLDGLDAARQIRHREPAGSRLPIIAITASIVADHRTSCLDAGMDDVLVKPVTIDALDSALRRWLPRTVSRSTRQSPHQVPPTPLPPTSLPPAPLTPTGPSGSPADDMTRHWDGPATTGRSSIDLWALDELERDTGDRSVVGVIIDTYLDEPDQRLDSIAAATDIVRSGETEVDHDVRRAAHTLGSTATLVGATRLAHLCAQLQMLATDHRQTESIIVAQAVITEGRRTAVDLQRLRSQL